MVNDREAKLRNICSCLRYEIIVEGETLNAPLIGNVVVVVVVVVVGGILR